MLPCRWKRSSNMVTIRQTLTLTIVDKRVTNVNEMQTRLTMLKMACAIAGLFIIGMLFMQGCKEESPDLSSHYFPEMTIQERQHFSAYNWTNLEQVNLILESEHSGMASLRAVNGEIILQVFLEKGIKEDIRIAVPKDLNRIMIEYRNHFQDVSLGAKKITLEF
jgi:hypothetical protein